MLMDWLFLGMRKRSTRAVGLSLPSSPYWMWCDRWKRFSPQVISVKGGSPHASKRLVSEAFDMLIGLLLYAGSPTAELP